MKYAPVVLVTYSAYDLARVVDNRDSLLERHVVVKVLLPTSWSFSLCQDTARRSLIEIQFKGSGMAVEEAGYRLESWPS